MSAVCICDHLVDEHELEDDGDPVILQVAPCRVKGCDCDDWDAPDPFPGRPPIWTAVVGLAEDGRVTVTEGSPTDLDLIVGHPFEPATFRDAWPGICGHLVDGWPCGYTRTEHER